MRSTSAIVPGESERGGVTAAASPEWQPADDAPAAVRDAVHVELDRVVEELVHEDRLAVRGGDGLRGVFLQLLRRGDDRHRAPAEDEARAHEDGVAELRGDPARVGDGVRDAARRLLHARLGDERLELVAVLGAVDVARRRAEHLHARRLEPRGEVERGLSPELDDRAVAPLALVDLHRVLERERLEVEPVARVVVGGDRLGVGVHHHDLEPPLPQRERRVAAAPVELDSLPDPVRPPAEDQDLAAAACGRRRMLNARCTMHNGIAFCIVHSALCIVHWPSVVPPVA